MVHNTKFEIDDKKIISVSFNDETNEFEASISYRVKKSVSPSHEIKKEEIKNIDETEKKEEGDLLI